MAYVFVNSYFDYGTRGQVPVLGITVHMAEGGGTVGYLSRQNPNGVSVHYVIEYSGRIVQMLAESRVNGSINPRDIRTTNDDPYTIGGETVIYGASAAKRALGAWWSDPNRATIGIEIEGFAKDGPNAKQAASLVELIRDIHTRFPKAHNLAHRDFADYKACPGKRIDWPALGGHGEPSELGDTTLNHRYLGPADGTVTIGAGRGLVNLVTGEAVIPDTTSFRTYSRLILAEPFDDAGVGESRQKGYAVNFNKQSHLALDDVVEGYVPNAVAPAPAPASYEVLVGGKPVGSVTLP